MNAIRSAVHSKAFETNIADFISRRLDELVRSETPLGEMFTPDAVALLKEKANEQIEPTIHQLAELAAAEKTRDSDQRAHQARGPRLLREPFVL